jgi:hypothetical protein
LGCLDKSLWVELISKGTPPRDYLDYMPDLLRHDPEVVDAHLRWCFGRHDEVFLRFYNGLPLATQLQFAHRLAEAIQKRTDSFFRCHWEEDVHRELLLIPEVALAAITRRWGPHYRYFSGVVEASSWSRDPEFLLSVAKLHHDNEATFWECCCDDLRRDKAFLMRVLKLDRVPRLDMDYALESDFDIMCARFERSRSRDFEWTPSDREREFVAQVRTRLVDYLALETFLWGVSSRPRTSATTQVDDVRSLARPPLTLLGQDCYTLAGLQNRLVECLGSASSHEDAASLRRVSNEFTKFGY